MSPPWKRAACCHEWAVLENPARQAQVIAILAEVGVIRLTDGGEPLFMTDEGTYAPWSIAREEYGL